MGAPKDGGSAFPVLTMEDTHLVPGMSLRDYFAAQAMTAIIALGATDPPVFPLDETAIAETAFTVADGMIAEREKERAVAAHPWANGRYPQLGEKYWDISGFFPMEMTCEPALDSYDLAKVLTRQWLPTEAEATAECTRIKAEASKLLEVKA